MSCMVNAFLVLFFYFAQTMVFAQDPPDELNVDESESVVVSLEQARFEKAVEKFAGSYVTETFHGTQMATIFIKDGFLNYFYLTPTANMVYGGSFAFKTITNRYRSYLASMSGWNDVVQDFTVTAEQMTFTTTQTVRDRNRMVEKTEFTISPTGINYHFSRKYYHKRLRGWFGGEWIEDTKGFNFKHNTFDINYKMIRSSKIPMSHEFMLGIASARPALYYKLPEGMLADSRAIAEFLNDTNTVPETLETITERARQESLRVLSLDDFRPLHCSDLLEE